MSFPLPVIGLTGGIAAGKSTVARLFRREGCPVIDADALARLVLEPDGAAYGPVIRHFGTGILDEDRRIDRQRLGGLVFAMSLLGIVATHKIAGPAFAVRRNLSRIADGELPQVRALRPGDELQSVGEELQRMVGTLRGREQKDVELLANTILALTTSSASGPDPALLEALKAAHKEKHERLNQA